jgi:hypothetical protein
MKRMVVMLSIVGALLTCGVVSQVWLKNYTEQMSDQLELLSDAVGSGEEIRYEIGAILNEWEQYQKRLGLWTSENYLDPLESHLKNAELLSRYAEDDTYRHQLRLELMSAADAAEELWQKEKISVQNIL